MSFPDDPRDLKVWASFGHTDAEDLTSVPFTQVSPDPDDGTDPGPVLGPIRIKRGRVGDSGTTDPASIDLGGLRNADGRFSRRNVSSPLYGLLRRGTPWQVTVDIGSGDEAVATASVQDFTPQRRGPGIDLKVPAKAEGLLARLGREQESLSPLTRTMLYYTRFAGSIMVGYWPMEDPDGAGSFASGIAGDQPVTVQGDAEFAAASDLAGSKPLPVLGATTRLSAPISGPFTSGSWHFQWFMKFDALPATSTVLMDVQTSGGDAARWTVSLSSASLTVTSYTSAGVVVLTASNPATSVPAGEWLYVAFLADIGAGSLQAYIYPLDISSPYASVNVSTVTDAGSPTRWLVPVSGELAGVAMGQVAIADSNSGLGFDDAAFAYYGERARSRLVGLLSLVGLDLSAGADLDSPEMGPQPIGPLMQLLREAEAVDGGVLYEARDGTLAFQPLNARYNASVAATLAYGTETEPADVHDLEMVDDDRDIANLVTVTRESGSSATVEQATGPVGTDADEGIGPRPLARTLNLYEDGQAVQHAGYLLALGTVDKPRYRVFLNPRSVAALRSVVLACDVGSRIQITGAPAEDHGPDTLDLIIEGEEILLDATEWRVAWWCEPFAPYQVNVLAEDDPGDDGDEPIGWLEADTCELASPVDEDDASWSITCDPAETSDADDFPFDVFVAGERVTVTASTGGTSPTWTVTRSANGASKSHDAGTAATLADPLVLSLI